VHLAVPHPSPFSTRIYMDVASAALAFHDHDSPFVKNQMINLSVLAVSFKSKIVEDKNFWLIRKSTPKIKRHLHFCLSASDGNLVCAMKLVKVFANHLM
jgi:hypothetical protein